ncbi:sigma-70 family RNA polymerase sigma factor [Membranicola marinus]|uniref:Sigma-70 family RNA polymerase sigma factor n=1 Tax=Membranihabitans marinus TaxID=1227546 RepID=A0A953HPB5_9BACT|nr:sigma-70 family RNA polymerase sigma factor [Membranihabitans marinus]MBY5958774.1 sigma-70 family RNA polymerase sigma factor [Membranihabitans marinus]
MEELVQQYRNRIYGFLLKYVKIPEQAEDLTQDVLIKLWKNRNRILSMEDQEAYILAVTRNQVRDHFKKMTREESYLQEVILHMPTQNSNEYAIIQRHELQESIQSVVAELPQRQQEVYKLFYDKGKSLKEIAIELNISPYTAKNHRAQALKFIRSRINPEAFLTGAMIIFLLLG